MRAKEFIVENSWKEHYSNPYQVLGLQPGASNADVTKAYRKMASQYHPDRVSPDKREEANKMMQYINTAKKSIETGDIDFNKPSQPNQPRPQPKREEAWTKEDYTRYGVQCAKRNMIFPSQISSMSKENQMAIINGYLSVTDRQYVRQNEDFIRSIMPQKKRSFGDKLGRFARRTMNMYDPVAANYGHSPWFSDRQDYQPYQK